MRYVYPVVLIEEEDGYYVRVPDFDASTQSKDLAEAIEMARDLMGIMAIDFEEDKKEIPKPNSVKFEKEKDSIITLVDVDFLEYRKKYNNKMIRKNLTIPYWLNVEAEKAGINFSQVLQVALKEKLNV
mgnify:FL=1